MTETNGLEISLRILGSLRGLEKPVTLGELIERERTGNRLADEFLTATFMEMLHVLKQDGMIKSDELVKADARVYGLTDDGVQMYQELRQIAGAQ